MTPDQEKQVIEHIENVDNVIKSNKVSDTLSELDGNIKETIIASWLSHENDLLEYAKLELKDKSDKKMTDSMKKIELQVKLSVTCPFFSDFQTFLKELKKGTTNNDSIEMSQEDIESKKFTFKGLAINSIKSESYHRESIIGMTRVSKTAYNNGLNFGITLPTGNAFTAGEKAGTSSIGTLPTDKKDEIPSNSREGISYENFIAGAKGNFVDLYASSESSYGHRAVAFKGDDDIRYVLDPYTKINGAMGNSPKKLEDYMKGKKIVKAHFYESNGYKKVTIPEATGSVMESETSMTTSSEPSTITSVGATSADISTTQRSSNESSNESVEKSNNPKVENAIQWAVNVANNNSIGYERGGHGSNKGGYDCSGLVTSAFHNTGFGVPISGTKSMRKNFTEQGFEWVSPFDKNKLQRGDILLKENKHTELYLGDGKLVGARNNKDNTHGDSSGNEIAVTGSYDTTANYFLNKYKRDGVLRYTGKTA